MRCPACSQTLAENARCCDACGHPLARPCPACGAEQRPSARFCDQCGERVGDLPGASTMPARSGTAAPGRREPRSYTPRHLVQKILNSKSALEGERKQVSVLFADVKGSQDLAETVDVEEWHRLLDRFFTILAEGVHRFEGTINQYTGDGIMALFGAPIAHEEHAQRACYAALHLRDELRRFGDELRRTRGLNFSVRMGLNSGEVVVGRIGDDLRMDYTAQGHTVGLAARMEQLAEPGRVYLTEHTAELVEGFFQQRDLGAFEINGVADPIRVFELEGLGPLRTRLDLSRARGFSRFVGREPELSTLHRAMARALQGNGQTIGIVAEPGVGKSRLCYEFAAACRRERILVREARAAPHGRHIPFLPLLELLRAYIGIGDHDSDEDIRRKIAGTLVLLDAELESALPLVFEFLGVPDPGRPSPQLDPEERRQRLFSVLRGLLHAHGRNEPALIIIEDLHWIDDGSEAFLAHLADDVPGTPTLLVFNYRPEYRGEIRDRTDYQEIELDPLGPEATDELLRDLLGGSGQLERLRALIQERAGGNPFFIEEIIRSLVEEGGLSGERGAYLLARPISEIEVPLTVQPLLAARIDRLDEGAKQVLQTAAVIGSRFSAAILESIADADSDAIFEALQVLIEEGYIHAISLYPTTEYAFRHPLTHDVAYRAQLFDRRARMHRAVAQTLEESVSEQADDRAALQAHHWEAAGEPLPAALAHRRAAKWLAENNPTQAVGHWRRAIALIRGRPESEETLALALEGRTALLTFGWRLGLAETEAETLFAEGRALAERIGDPARLARVLMSYGQIRTWTASRDPERALELAKEAVRLSEQTEDTELQSASHGQLARAYWRVRDYRAALAETEAGQRLSPTSNQQARFRGRILAEIGDLGAARENLENALELAQTQGDTWLLALTHLCWGHYARFLGDFDLERIHGRHALELADRTDDLFSRAQGLFLVGEAQLRAGLFDEAISALRDSLEVTRRPEMNLRTEPATLGLLAEAHLGLGQGDAALEAAEAALEGEAAPEPHALLALVRVLLAAGDPEVHERVEGLLDSASSFVKVSGARSWIPWIRLERAALAAARGDTGDEKRHLRKARAVLEEIGATHHLQRLERERERG